MSIERALSILHRKPRDPAAQQTIAVGVYDSLLAYVASLLVTFRMPGETAADVVHDVLIGFFENPPQAIKEIQSERSLLAYLRTSCRNRLIDKYRHEQVATQLVDFLSTRFDVAFQTETDLYRSIFIKEIIGMLPAECGSLFEQFVNEDLSPAEIADRLNAAPAKFYSRWYRCIQKAKEILLKKNSGLKRLSD